MAKLYLIAEVIANYLLLIAIIIIIIIIIITMELIFNFDYLEL